MSQKWLFDILSKLTNTPSVIWRHSGLNKRCSRWGLAHMRLHTITCLVCCPKLQLGILGAFMTQVSYQLWLGDKAFCNEPSFVLVHVSEHFSTIFRWYALMSYFFTGRYKGQILTAIGVDCNNQIVPLAFAFVERLKIHVVADSCCCCTSRCVPY